MPRANYQASTRRVVLGLTAGAVTGAITFWIGAAIVDQSPFTRSLDLAGFLLLIGVTSVIWLAGLAVFACPIWWILHKAKIRGPMAAVTLGVVLTLIFFFGYGTGWFGLDPPSFDSSGRPIANPSFADVDWSRGIEAAGWMAPLGAAVGLVVWRVAYR